MHRRGLSSKTEGNGVCSALKYYHSSNRAFASIRGIRLLTIQVRSAISSGPPRHRSEKPAIILIVLRQPVLLLKWETGNLLPSRRKESKLLDALWTIDKKKLMKDFACSELVQRSLVIRPLRLQIGYQRFRLRQLLLPFTLI